MDRPVARFPLIPCAAVAALAVLALWFFPLFHVVPLAASAATASTTAFDPASAAAKIWKSDLQPAARRALDLRTLAGPLRKDAGAARAQFAKSAGLGAAYYFIRGSGRVVAHERTLLRIALDGTGPAVIALRIGPIFGNTVRDGCGLLDVNAFPGLAEFNALSTELNQLVEKNVLPDLRNGAAVGTTVHFAGCAEAPENAPDGEEPLLTIVPVQAEVR